MSDDKQPEIEHSSQTADNMSTEQDSKRKSRRRMLTGGGIIGAGAVSGAWTKPALNSVILPAHAVTSEVEGEGGMMTPAPTPAPTMAMTMVPTAAPTGAPTPADTDQ